MNREDWIRGLIKCIDNSDTEGFVSYLSDDVVFRFGNIAPVSGIDNVGQAVGGFFDSIKTLSHSLDNVYEQNDAVISHGTVTYTRHDNSTLTVPFANIFKMHDDKIKDYLIFIDTSELYK